MLQEHFHVILIGTRCGRYHYGLQFSKEEAELLAEVTELLGTLKITHLSDEIP